MARFLYVPSGKPPPTGGTKGHCKFSDENADADIEVDGVQGCINALRALRQHHRQLKIILSVGGNGQGSTYFATIARDEVLRHMFARNVRDFVDMYDFDGIDSDGNSIPTRSV